MPLFAHGVGLAQPLADPRRRARTTLPSGQRFFSITLAKLKV
jgi:hypothetical protein